MKEEKDKAQTKGEIREGLNTEHDKVQLHSDGLSYCLWTIFKGSDTHL